MDQEFKKALSYSFVLLKYRARSRYEIITRLKKRNVSESTIQSVVDYLQEHNYLNDKEFVRLFISSSLHRGWGPHKIDFSLKKLGIDQILREAVFENTECYQQVMQPLIEKKIIQYKHKKNPYQRIVRFLVGRGFSHPQIMQELEHVTKKL